MEKNKWHAFLFLLPSIFFFVVFSYWPLLQKPVFKLFQLEYGQPKHDVCRYRKLHRRAGQRGAYQKYLPTLLCL